MSLDALLQAGENVPPRTVKIKGRNARFLFGVEYRKADQTRFELVYESLRIGVRDVLIINLLKLIGHEDSQDSESGVPYIVNTTSLEELSSENAIEPLRDYRYIIFGSRAIYKLFFKVLNEKRINGTISKEDYQKIYDRIMLLFDRLYNGVRSTKNLFVIISNVKYLIKEFEQDELIAPYLEEAKLRLPYRLH